MSVRWGFDDVSGVVIGEILPVHAGLFYGGRPQGGPVHTATHEEARRLLKARMHSLIEECGPYCYNTGEAWEIRFYGEGVK